MQVFDLIKRRATGQVAGTVTIRRKTDAADAGGSVVSTFADHLPAIQAAVQIRSGAEAVRYGRESNRRFGTVYVQAGQDITSSDRLTFNGLTFDIQSVRTPDDRISTDLLAYMVLEVQETKP